MGSDINLVTCDYIEDGYTAFATLPPVEGSHNGISIVWRPCLSTETAALVDAKQDAGWIEAAIDLVAKKLERWNLKDSKGQPVPITKATVGRVRRSLLSAIANAVIFCELPNGTKLDVEADLKN